ncbi:MAG TPA: hypothetical protein VF602_03525, partial [Pedobacter sp.]
FSTFFFLLYNKIRYLSKNRLVTGVFYGAFIWVIMYMVVVPLSKVPPQPINLVDAIVNMVIIVTCIGIPLSFMANAYYSKG